MNLLQPDQQHRSIDLSQDRWADLDHVVGANGEVQSIKSRVMQLAEGDSVAHDRLTFGIAIGSDVGGIQEFNVSEVAESAPFLIGPDHTLPERNLVQALANCTSHVGATSFRSVIGHRVRG